MICRLIPTLTWELCSRRIRHISRCGSAGLNLGTDAYRRYYARIRRLFYYHEGESAIRAPNLFVTTTILTASLIHHLPRVFCLCLDRWRVSYLFSLGSVKSTRRHSRSRLSYSWCQFESPSFPLVSFPARFLTPALVTRRKLGMKEKRNKTTEILHAR